MSFEYSHLLQSAKSTIKTLVDNHGRPITYLRLAITDRCNLRCKYCVPEEGLRWLPFGEILTYEELIRLARIFAELGFKKLRLTGGEPFARRGTIAFLRQLKTTVPSLSLHITTNGILTQKYLDELKDLEISGLNLSLDTLSRKRYQFLTGEDGLAKVLGTLYGAMERNIPLKINSVVLPDTTDEDILLLAGLARKYRLCLRFIEQMSFNGKLKREEEKAASLSSLRDRIYSLISGLAEEMSLIGNTAKTFSVAGFSGTLGVIEGRTRRFCQSCNKVRITPEGVLKNCLYDRGSINIKDMMQEGMGDEDIKGKICETVQQRQVNGHVAEALTQMSYSPSMASIGG